MEAESVDGVEFVADGRGGMVVILDGQHQSHVDPADPGHLAFEYMQHFAAALEALPDGPLAVTHVGGAGMTLARYVNHTRPGSPQIVLEPDAALTERVRQQLPLPRRHRIRVRPQDGRTGTAALADRSADVIVQDAYAAGRLPADLASVEWFRETRRVLKADGLLLVNTADEPARRWVARLHAGLVEAFPHVAAIALHEVWKGRRFGNTVFLASGRPLDRVALARAVARSPVPSGLRSGTELRRVLGDAQPFTDADAEPSPSPPPTNGWRVR